MEAEIILLLVKLILRVYKYQSPKNEIRLIYMARYKRRYAYDQSLDLVVPLLVLLFLGVMYAMVIRTEQSYAGFILLAIASIFMVYWIRELKKMAKTEELRVIPKEIEEKTWVYDLIKGNQELVFVAEVPEPEDQVTVRLISGILYIRGGQGFARDVQLDVTENMGIAEFRYRNGVLTLKIRKI